MTGEKGYKTGEQPRRYGCQDYSLEMQLLQLKRRQLVETDPQALRRLEARIEEIENNLGM